MAKAATDQQAADMVQTWLMSPEHFAITAKGDFAGNSDANYWGLPSIEGNDTAFPALGYWRGYVWGPMAQLVYWSLVRLDHAPTPPPDASARACTRVPAEWRPPLQLEYDHVPIVRTARKALALQMGALLLTQWRDKRHTLGCLNYKGGLVF